MPRPRILVVDDAVVVRKIVTDVLAGDPGLEVIGTAPNGRIAISKIPQVNPDLVTLDVEMPEMDGIETLRAIRAKYPRLPVIMFSTLTERGANVTMEALLLGANDYVTKPANVGSVAEAMERVREQLIPKIHALCGIRPSSPSPTRAAPAPVKANRPVARPARRAAARVEHVTIGVSTGGPNALAELLPQLPADLPVPITIVQHMPPMFTRLLAERLDATSGLHVREASDRMRIEPGTVTVAPGDHHLEIRRVGTRVEAVLHDGPPENSCRPAVDVLFRSVAATHGDGTLAIVLTGMGYDGRRGSEHVRAAGGHVLAQDQASSVVWGMPGAVVEHGVADEVLPLSQVAAAIVRRVSLGRSDSHTTPAHATGAIPGTEVAPCRS
ncbi:chemotaxis response regulator protein-glutamate methylesterase [Nitriliruptoraceae bacterium ZYF776]|nr:chemotaxis response regulator protein-glutamate methylesterase [Profundirhabdus halotolerans]